MSDNEEFRAECECCGNEVGEQHYAGCCRDGDCPRKVDSMCDNCATWVADQETYWCHECYESTFTNCNECGESINIEGHRTISTIECGDFCKACFEDKHQHNCELCGVVEVDEEAVEKLREHNQECWKRVGAGLVIEGRLIEE